MCGRITLRTNVHEIAAEFQAALPGFEVRPRYNVSPGQFILVVRGEDTREIVQLRWGLIPSWAKDAKIALPETYPLRNSTLFFDFRKC